MDHGITYKNESYWNILGMGHVEEPEEEPEIQTVISCEWSEQGEITARPGCPAGKTVEIVKAAYGR